MSTALYDTASHDAVPYGAAPRNGARPRSGYQRGPHGSAPGDFAPRIYRGRSVDELIPRIVAELGEDAIVIRHHRGLTGGFAGFFQRAFVEIEARRGVGGSQLLDRYDDEDAAPALPDGGAPALPEGAALPPPDGGAPGLPEGVVPPLPDGAVPAPPRELEYPGETPASAPEEWDGPRQIWATNPFAEALAEAEYAVRAAEPTVPPDLDAALAAALAEAEDAGVPVEPTVAADLYAPPPDAFPEAEDAALPGEVEDAAAPTESTAPADLYAPPAELPAGLEDAEVPAQPVTAALCAVPLSRGRAREEIEQTLGAVGIGEEFVHELIEGAIAHVLPLMPASTSLAQAVHAALRQRIPACPPLPAGGAAIALVGAGGSGKSACCAALLEAYREHSTLPATCATVPLEAAPEEPALREAREGGLLLLDTPPVSSADPGSIGALAELLALLAPDRVVLALPATLGATPAAQLLQALRPLNANALAITHADETDQLGVAVQAACTFGPAPVYLLARAEPGCADGGLGARALTGIDPSLLVDRLLPPR
jgi:hypothetical protein